MAKVSKINKTNNDGKIFTYWCVDARSIGLKRYLNNPNTKERFETKKDAEIFLDKLKNIEVKRHQSNDANRPQIEPQKDDLLVSDMVDGKYCKLGLNSATYFFPVFGSI